MKKRNIFSLLTLATLGTMAYLVNYFIQNDEFSEETIEEFNHLDKKKKNVGNDVKRTYTSLGNKKNFENSTKSLGNSAKKLYSSGLTLVKGASNDIYTHFSDKFNYTEKTTKGKVKEKTKKNNKTKNPKNKK